MLFSRFHEQPCIEHFEKTCRLLLTLSEYPVQYNSRTQRCPWQKRRLGWCWLTLFALDSLLAHMNNPMRQWCRYPTSWRKLNRFRVRRTQGHIAGRYWRFVSVKLISIDESNTCGCLSPRCAIEATAQNWACSPSRVCRMRSSAFCYRKHSSCLFCPRQIIIRFLPPTTLIVVITEMVKHMSDKRVVYWSWDSLNANLVHTAVHSCLRNVPASPTIDWYIRSDRICAFAVERSKQGVFGSHQCTPSCRTQIGMVVNPCYRWGIWDTSISDPFIFS